MSSPLGASLHGELSSAASSPTVNSPAPLHSPLSAAASPLQRHLRHTQLFPALAPSMVGLSATTTTATTATSTSSTTSPRIGSSVEAMASRTTALKAGARAATTSWQPTRLTSPYCVLSAAGVQEDFYTSTLSWGTDQMALALPQDLVLFHPSRPRQSSSTARVSEAPSGTDVDASTALHAPRRATAVAMTRFREISCFLGFSSGALELYEGRGDGRLHRTLAFAMPEPPTEYLSSLLGGSDGGTTAASQRAARALSLLSSSVSSISCVGTSSRHPWLGAVATAARGLLTVDARQPQPALRFGGEEQMAAGATGVDNGAEAFALPSPLSQSSSVTSASEGGGLSRLQRASAFLRQHDRLCSVSWNSTGSLVATGSSGGIVKVWSLSAPQRPLHSFLIDHDCSVKALSFHPERPYELLVGASAGPAGLRTYDLSSADPLLIACGVTAAAVTQAVYDPEGNYAVTSAGTPAGPTAPFTSVPSTHGMPGATRTDARSSSTGTVQDRSPRWRLSPPSHAGIRSSAAVALLHGFWDDMDDAAEAVPAYLADDDLRIPGTSAANSTAGLTVAHRTPPNALVVWRCGRQRRDTHLRDALLRENVEEGEEEAGHEDANDDGRLHLAQPFDGEDVDAKQEVRYTHASAPGELRAGRASGPLRESESVLSWGTGSQRSEWMPMTALPGHRARPLMICAPFPQSPFAGCYASVAAGEDGTIRFWRLFDTVSDATHWQHRRQAQQRSATTQEDMDLFTTPVLR